MGNKERCDLQFQREGSRLKSSRFHGFVREGKVVQLFGAFLEPGNRVFEFPEFPDPAPPFENRETGEIELYGSSVFSLVWRNWKDFNRGGDFEAVDLRLRHPNGALIGEGYTHAWDVRKYRALHLDGTTEDFLVGGVMPPPPGKEMPKWPQDNARRRLFIFRNGVRSEAPLIHSFETGWRDHTYGANFFQEGMTNPNFLDLRKPLYLFYEKVSMVREDGWPYKTEQFVVKMRNLEEALEEPVKILEVGDPPLGGTGRGDGGYLIEGGRPFEVSLNGRKYFILGFSCSDFCTDRYGGNIAYSQKLDRDWIVVRDGNAHVKDFLSELKADLHLSWTGRPAFFKTPLDKSPAEGSATVQMVFHAVDKKIHPRRDYNRWPRGKRLLDYYRFPLKMSLRIEETAPGVLYFELMPDEHISLNQS